MSRLIMLDFHVNASKFAWSPEQPDSLQSARNLSSYFAYCIKYGAPDPTKYINKVTLDNDITKGG